MFGVSQIFLLTYFYSYKWHIFNYLGIFIKNQKVIWISIFFSIYRKDYACSNLFWIIYFSLWKTNYNTHVRKIKKNIKLDVHRPIRVPRVLGVPGVPGVLGVPGYWRYWGYRGHWVPGRGTTFIPCYRLIQYWISNIWFRIYRWTSM